MIFCGLYLFRLTNCVAPTPNLEFIIYLLDLLIFIFLIFFLILQEDIFQQPGLRSDFAEIRDCLDTGMPDSLRILVKCCYDSN